MRKTISLVLTISLLGWQMLVPFSSALAIDRPDRPSITSDTSTPDAPDTPDAPNVGAKEEPQDETPVEGKPVEVVEGPSVEEMETSNTPSEPETPDAPDAPVENSVDSEKHGANADSDNEEETSEIYKAARDQALNEYYGDPNSNQIGDVSVKTGDSTVSGAVTNSGNTNAATEDTAQGPSVAISNEGNGSNSENSGAVVIDESSTTIQDNNANLDNSLDLYSSSGDNHADQNVGDVDIETGNANVTGTITNFVNTNIDGVMISAFEVADDQVGDLILDFEANCISGCGEKTVTILNEENGDLSENTGTVKLAEDTLTFQNNDATVENELILNANSGNNSANDNVAGDQSITTGDANASGSVLNFLNNNFAGKVVYGVVDIFGNMVGDIILPESALTKGASKQVTAQNTGNGAESTNTADVDLTETDEYYQFNNADIVNNLVLDANTGENQTSGNIGGDNTITTGNASVDAQVLNIANNNFVGGNFWIVLINEAGNWFGQLVGEDGNTIGDNFAIAGMTDHEVTENGTVNVGNKENGDESVNTGEVAMSSESSTIQNNNAAIVNNIDISANSGDNEALRNTGGSTEIETGDANVMLNLVNFVNNNFAGGNIFVTVVNVFGSWTGDFLTPGAVKAEDDDTSSGADDNGNGSGGIGGVGNDTSSGTNGGGSSSHTSSSPSSSSSSGSSADNQSVLPIASNQNSSSYRYGRLASGVSDAQVDDEYEEVDTGEVAGISDEDEGTKINLAWLLLLIPLLGVGMLARRVIRRA